MYQFSNHCLICEQTLLKNTELASFAPAAQPRGCARNLSGRQARGATKRRCNLEPLPVPVPVQTGHSTGRIMHLQGEITTQKQNRVWLPSVISFSRQAKFVKPDDHVSLQRTRAHSSGAETCSTCRRTRRQQPDVWGKRRSCERRQTPERGRRRIKSQLRLRLCWTSPNLQLLIQPN